ncbi:hypothetical protein ACWCYY_05275 [Kitasatospora sp. NPDC001664]|uniref:hypothetical protein n=1 Tax=Kitasatospora albolonga TaxID=68173 RepID=UPI0035E638CB
MLRRADGLARPDQSVHPSVGASRVLLLGPGPSGEQEGQGEGGRQGQCAQAEGAARAGRGAVGGGPGEEGGAEDRDAVAGPARRAATAEAPGAKAP